MCGTEARIPGRGWRLVVRELCAMTPYTASFCLFCLFQGGLHVNCTVRTSELSIILVGRNFRKRGFAFFFRFAARVPIISRNIESIVVGC